MLNPPHLDAVKDNLLTMLMESCVPLCICNSLTFVPLMSLFVSVRSPLVPCMS